MLCYAKSLQSCPTLCNLIDSSPPGSPVPGILQARTLERVAISFSNAWEWKVKGKSLSHVRLFETPWTAAFQAPPSMGFSRQEYWSGVPLPSPTILLNWFIRFDTYFVDSISFYICNHVISKLIHFICSFPIWMLFIFLGLIRLARTSSTVLNTSNTSNLLLLLRGKSLVFHH